MIYLCERMEPTGRARDRATMRRVIDAPSAVMALMAFRRASEAGCRIENWPADAASIRLPRYPHFLWAEPADGRRRSSPFARSRRELLVRVANRQAAP